jgi:GAF domain-containing protein
LTQRHRAAQALLRARAVRARAGGHAALSQSRLVPTHSALIHDELVTAACQQAQRLLHARASRHEVLQCLVRAAESVSGDGSTASILVLDDERLLRNGCSPNLPDDYLAAIDRLAPHPDVGTCAAAAATGAMVVTPDFRADGKWAELRHLPLSLGYLGAWSLPIKSDADEVLGTFGTYYRAVRSPTEREIATVRRLAAFAARVLQTAG